LDELAAQVAAELAQLAMEQSNGQVSAVPDARTLRYYATLGLLDRPVEVRGRRALYGERHVLQAVAVKALQAQGLALNEIQQRLTGRTDDQLRAAVARPGGARFWRQAPVATPVPATQPPGTPAPPPPSLLQRPPTSAATAAGPAATAIAAGDGAPASPGGQQTDPIAVRLAPGVTLVIEPARAPEQGDIDAIRAAASALIAELAARQLNLPTVNSPRADKERS
jgi:DNA-binding transcriptional MerR regulator